jgi:23S rRNA (adenine2030-N6)-methyltransferase
LIFCLDYLRRKEKPLLCVDTHAGAGLYLLEKGETSINREWEGGFGRLSEAGRIRGLNDSPDTPLMARRYLELAGESGGGAGGSFLYPGSPAIIAGLLRPRDRLVCFELHPADYESLRDTFRGRKQVEVRKEDGPAGLKSLLPPPSRRGLIFIDPSWELKTEFRDIRTSLSEALRRFPEGIYIIWYPLLRDEKIKTGKDGPGLSQSLLNLYQGRRCRAELYASPRVNSPRGMYGSGLVIFNPPWTLRPALEESLPFLAAATGGSPGGWDLLWEDTQPNPEESVQRGT